jgi:two-component system chemotaxis response regulator CheB
MPPGFTKSLAERLNSLSAIEVKEAEHGDVIRPGLALIAPGDYHMRVERTANQQVQVAISQDALIGGHRPAVDPMFLSVAEVFKENTVGVILTGMGRDGTIGLKAIKERGGHTIAEDQSTAVVYGMPRSAKESGVVDKMIPLPLVASMIVDYVTQ